MIKNICLYLGILFLSTFAFGQPPLVPDGTLEAKKAIAKIQKLPPNFKVDLWAAEPMLGNTVAFCIDEKGRIYTAESYRFNRGTEEYRHRPFFLEGDLQNSSTQQRLEMYQKFADKFPGGMNFFTKYSERIRLLEDTKGEGRADKATTFAEGFNEPLDGLAAGVLAKDGDVYFTCIPHLWKLKDDNGKGAATRREKLLSGFGVQTAFLGHDLHGLAFGPDGKLYFSVGDRGYSVASKEGEKFVGPRNGAVFRCDPDGSHFEVVHKGLRNPQELAFDQFGNLFTADNNCDKGDASRLVYIVEGGNSGWNMAYQTMESPYLTGPWHAEKLWHLPHESQPAWIIPPIGHLGAGPSGFTFTSGLGLPGRYKNAFLMCNFTSSQVGGIDAFRVVSKGAGFELVDYHQMAGPGLFTDCEFGYDGKLYFSDWVEFTWDGGGVGKSRIYTAYDPKAINDPAISQMKKVFAQGFQKSETKELIELFNHGDMRVRLRAQYELVSREAQEELQGLALNNKNQQVRLHAVWGLGQLARKNPKLLNTFRKLTEDADVEIQAQVAKIIGDVHPTLEKLNNDFWGDTLGLMLIRKSPRVQFFAAQALGKLKYQKAIPWLYELLEANKDQDLHLRHAAVTSLARLKGGDLDHFDRSVRLGSLLALRQSKESVGTLLFDKDIEIVTEAARAINDEPIEKDMPVLANLWKRYFQAKSQPPEALGRRIIHANFRLGQEENAEALIEILADPNISTILRKEALACLNDWGTPGPRDRVIGFWRPLQPRSTLEVTKLVEANLEKILSNADESMQTEVIQLIGRLNVPIDEIVIAAWIADAEKPSQTRIESLRLLAARKSVKTEEYLTQALDDAEPRLRAAARDLISTRDPKRGIDLIAKVLEKGDLLEQQSALRTLAKSKQPKAQSLLEDWLNLLKENKVATALQLDVFQSAKTTANQSMQKRISEYQETLRKAGTLAPYRMTLAGGDAQRGKNIFISHASGQCVRCHKVEGQGGDSGPDLTEWAPKGNREHFLESLIQPDKTITQGFGAFSFTLDSGKTITGMVKSEDKEKIVLLTQDQKLITIAVKEIEFRSDPKSLMPAMGQVLSLDEMRDMIEFLASLKKRN